MKSWVLALLVLVFPATAWAQDEPTCPEGKICVSEGEMQTIVSVLREKQCMQKTKPEFKLDPITLVVDKDGRVFYTGAEPKPYTVRMDWCNYEVEATGKVNLVAAMHEDPVWGFRLRPKAYMGALLLEPVYDEIASDEPAISNVIDAGVMLDFLYYKDINLNAALGFRSVGAGVGLDVTRNFGISAGYGLTWGTWRHNPNVAVWFGF